MPTRATLVADIAEWADKPTIVEGSSIANSVLRITQSMLDRRIRPAINVKSVRLTPVSESVVRIPEDALTIQSVAVDEDTENVNFVQPDSLLSVSYVPPGAFAEISLPGTFRTDRIYTIVSEELRFSPGFTEPYPGVWVGYHAKLPPLVNPGDTNWLLNNAYDVYLFAGLVAAATYMQDLELESLYNRRYNDAVVEFTRAETRKFTPVLVEDLRLTATGLLP